MAAVLVEYPVAVERDITHETLNCCRIPMTPAQLRVDGDSGRWSWAHNSVQDDDGWSSDCEETATPLDQECSHRIHASLELLPVRETDGYFVSCSPALAPELLQSPCPETPHDGGAFVPVPPSPPPILRSARLSSLGEDSSSIRFRFVGKLERPLSVETVECQICFDTVREDHVSAPKCCLAKVCSSCAESLVVVNVSEGRTHIPCPASGCSKPLDRDYILRHLLTYDMKNKYERFRLSDERGFGKKACPNCCLITERSDIKPFKSKSKKKLIVTPEQYMITCESCAFEWCFNCQSPWHKGTSCVNYREGDSLFKKWTKTRNKRHIPNCQRCPKCKILIERTEGCNSMVCNQCSTNFCYQCGGRFRSIAGLGNHYKRSSILGCPYNCFADHPHRRRLYRGGYLSSKVIAVTGYPFLLVGGLAVGAVVLVAGGMVVLPVWGAYKLYKIHRRRQRHQRS